MTQRPPSLSRVLIPNGFVHDGAAKVYFPRTLATRLLIVVVVTIICCVFRLVDCVVLGALSICPRRNDAELLILVINVVYLFPSNIGKQIITIKSTRKKMLVCPARV